MDPITAYHDLTETIVAVTGFSRPMLHLHAGMAIYLLAQVALGERRGSWAALTSVLAAELGNEVMNRLYWGSWRWSDTIADIAITLFWPAACLAVSRLRRQRWNETAAARSAAPLADRLALLEPGDLLPRQA